MSKIMEYLRLLPKGLANADKIVEAVINITKLEEGDLPQDEQDEIVRRRLICKACPYMSENATTSEEYLELSKKHYSSDRDDEHCTMCGCPITTKTASLSSNCGIESFNKKHKTTLPLKWTKYDS